MNFSTYNMRTDSLTKDLIHKIKSERYFRCVHCESINDRQYIRGKILYPHLIFQFLCSLLFTLHLYHNYVRCSSAQNPKEERDKILTIMLAVDAHLLFSIMFYFIPNYINYMRKTKIHVIIDKLFKYLYILITSAITLSLGLNLIKELFGQSLMPNYFLSSGDIFAILQIFLLESAMQNIVGLLNIVLDPALVGNYAIGQNAKQIAIQNLKK